MYAPATSNRYSVNPVSKATAQERFVLSAARERWLAFLALEHETLCPLASLDVEAGEVVVRRVPARGRPVSAGRIPRDTAPALLLQAAGAAAFLHAHGFWLDEEDLAGSVWEPGTCRLWLSRTPACVGRGGAGPATSAVLAGFVLRLFGRGRGVSDPAARTLLDRLLTGDAASKRAEFWLASVFRAFPALSAPEAAEARRRTIGYAGEFSRDAPARALLAAARSRLSGRAARVFSRGESELSPGGALDMPAPFPSLGRAVRFLRERHEAEAASRSADWIAVEPGSWDGLSRRAFEAAARSLAGRVQVIVVETLPAPLHPDEWRREIYVPCGTLHASLRFYEELARVARADPPGARRAARDLVGTAGWAAFASDPTGDAPLPAGAPFEAERTADRTAAERDVLEHVGVSTLPVPVTTLLRALPGPAARRAVTALLRRGDLVQDLSGRLSLSAENRSSAPPPPARRREICRRWAAVEEDSPGRIRWLLEAREIEAALEEGERWKARLPAARSEHWFELSARLSAACPPPLPPWLEALEAERDLAGGRPEEAEERLWRLASWPAASPAERRLAALRHAEVLASLGRVAEAGRRAAAWRRAFPHAPAEETVRAVRLEAGALAREGRHESALDLLEEADRSGTALPPSEGIETALVRARVCSLAGRFRDEADTYARLRPAVFELHDEALTARFLSQEALGLADRREFAASIARLEEALAVLEDEPAQRAGLLIDLAGTLYHAGRPARCLALLDEAILAAAAAGREDLGRTARSNRLELLINRGDFDEAGREAEDLVERARRERDDLRLLVALHHRSRLALRRGLLSSAARDNEDARSLAVARRDRLETGELWLEEGDRLALEGGVDQAREAWERAAADPPDRCDSSSRAAERLTELAWRDAGPPPEAAASLERSFSEDEYAAAEKTARWRVLFPGRPVPSAELCARAEAVLRARGGEALADRAFGPVEASADLPTARLRALRDAVARALAGEPGEGEQALRAAGFTGLALHDEDGRALLRLGRPESDTVSRRLEGGAVAYRLDLSPARPESLVSAVALLLETLLYRTTPPAAPTGFAEGWGRFGIVTADPAMEEPYRRLVRFAPQPLTVLILGESGAGKEAVARAVHGLSPRSSGPFVAVNVAAIPAALLESDLFGHARGAFTGAERDRPGLFEEAARGTIFLDEVGDLPLPLQAKLLRALQEREVRRVGENRARPLDVRVVSATSRDLEKEVEAGRFREDLFYRIHVAVIQLPPLSRRGRDVGVLARHFLRRYAREYGRGLLDLAPEALAALSAHGWPGNVRELQNAMAQAAALADSDSLVGLQHLPETLRREKRPAAPATQDYRSRMDAHRRGLITEALERAGGNRSRAARDLGLSRQALLYLIRELNVASRPRSGH
jgi:DNA-binding NtrC family response regulator/tetratricopeptide (TPR) repeat protein